MLRATLCTASVVATLAFASSSAGLDNEDEGPGPFNLAQCLDMGGKVDQPEGSAIRACCLDGLIAKGCFICNYRWEDCVFDGGYRKIKNKLVKLKGAQTDTMAPSQ